MKVRVSDHQGISPTGKSVKGNLSALVRQHMLFLWLWGSLRKGYLGVSPTHFISTKRKLVYQKG